MTDSGAEKEWVRRKDDPDYWWNRGVGDIITDFVRREVAGRSWEDRAYIYDLIALEEFCIRGARSWTGGMSYHHLRQKYPEEHRAIKSELDPGWPARDAQREVETLQSRDELLARHHEAQQEAARKAEQDRIYWEQLGGRL